MQEANTAPDSKEQPFVYQRSRETFFSTESSKYFHVVIAGATPVSVSLAHALTLAGMHVCLLDRTGFGLRVPVSKEFLLARKALSAYFVLLDLVTISHGFIEAAISQGKRVRSISFPQSSFLRQLLLTGCWLRYGEACALTVFERQYLFNVLLAGFQEGVTCISSARISKVSGVSTQLLLELEDLESMRERKKTIGSVLLVDCDLPDVALRATKVSKAPRWKITGNRLILEGDLQTYSSHAVKKGFELCRQKLGMSETFPRVENRPLPSEFQAKEAIREFRSEAEKRGIDTAAQERICRWYGGRVRRFLERREYFDEISSGVYRGEILIPLREEPVGSCLEIFHTRLAPFLHGAQLEQLHERMKILEMSEGSKIL